MCVSHENLLCIFGAQAVHCIMMCVVQSQFPDVDGSELSELDKEICDLQQRLQESRTHCQSLSSGLLANIP